MKASPAAIAGLGSSLLDPGVSMVTVSRLGLRLTPQGRLVSEQALDSPVLEDKIAVRFVEAFGFIEFIIIDRGYALHSE
jgi:hypothetical protein